MNLLLVLYKAGSLFHSFVINNSHNYVHFINIIFRKLILSNIFETTLTIVYIRTKYLLRGIGNRKQKNC